MMASSYIKMKENKDECPRLYASQRVKLAFG